MRLRDLNPKLVGTLGDGVLIFDCPSGNGHRVRVPLGGGTAWTATGEFPDSVSVFPSIAEAHCWHGMVTAGECTGKVEP